MRCTLDLSASYSINIPYNTQVTGITCTPYTKAKKEWVKSAEYNLHQLCIKFSHEARHITDLRVSAISEKHSSAKTTEKKSRRGTRAKGEKSSRCRSAVSWFSMFKNFMAQAIAYQIKNHALPKVEKKPHAQKIAQPTNLKIIVRPLMYSK